MFEHLIYQKWALRAMLTSAAVKLESIGLAFGCLERRRTNQVRYLGTNLFAF